MTTIEKYTDAIILAAKEQGFTTTEQIEENFEGLFIYVLSLEASFLNKMLLKANDKEIMNIIALKAFHTLRK